MSHPAERYILAYDDSCGPCSSFRAIVGFLDARKRIEFVPLETAAESELLRDVPHAARLASFHLVSPSSSGAFGRGAVSGPAAVLPLLRLLSPSTAVGSKVLGRIPRLQAALTFSYSALSRLHRGCPTSSDRHLARSALAESG
ncbi:MAG TPA: DCC1-like thiol-disulfide oxidoreductase family protein [Nitrososphaerales archaeon]|nr:DCC1-like thiol-disulfide oxidoreductase family protein [Nitrososphaerales archaeon]